MKKRFFSFLMALIMLLGMIPANVFAAEEETMYFIDDTLWLPEGTEPTAPVVETGHWVRTEETKTETKDTCTVPQHVHVDNCPADESGFTCDGHVHTDACKGKVYDHEAHTHTEDCKKTVYSCGKTESKGHQHSQRCCTAVLNCGKEVGADAHTHGTACYKEVQNLVCGQDGVEGHTHVAECYTAASKLSCGKTESKGHAHVDGCYKITEVTCKIAIGTGAHAHTETCIPSPACTVTAEHTHDDSCAYTLSEGPACGLEAHVHVTDGCGTEGAYTCGQEAHTHGESCSSSVTMVKWIVELKEDAASDFAERGLPLHFFIAEPGEAANPDGNYVNYKQNLWASAGNAYATADATNHSQIGSTQGIRNANYETDITQYVYSWPTGYDANTFKNYGTMTIRGQTYSQEEYEIKWVTICKRGTSGLYCYCGVNYAHVHIDGVLTKKVEPGEMHLHKEITAIQEQDQTFTFTLERLEQDSSFNPTNNVIAGSAMTLTATVPAGSTTADIVSSSNAEVGFGYYKLTENTNHTWENTSNKIGSSTVNPGSVYIQVATDGTVKYSSSATSGYRDATGATIVNALKSQTVTYAFYKGTEADDADPAAVPADPPQDTEATRKPGTSVPVNTSFKKGSQVEDLVHGKLYTFQGWDYYTANGTTVEIDNDNPGSFTMPAAAVTIYGKWKVSDLSEAAAYINIEKKFVGLPDGAADNIELGFEEYFAYPDNFYVSRREIVDNVPGTSLDTEMEGSVRNGLSGLNESGYGDYDITNNAATWSGEKYTFNADGSFILAEHNHAIPGYTMSSSITSNVDTRYVTVENVDATGTSVIFDVDVPYVSGVTTPAATDLDALNMGTITFTNTYTRKSGENILVLPDLGIDKLDADTQNPVVVAAGGVGATFTLYKVEGTVQTPISENVSANASGRILFEDLAEGSYVLKETQAPSGYQLSNLEYAFSVEEGSREEVYDAAQDAYVDRITYVINSVSNAEVTAPAGTNTVYHVDITNKRLVGSIALEKHFWLEGDTEGDREQMTNVPGNLELSLDGPYETANVEDTIDGIAPSSRTVELNSIDGWKTTVANLPYGWYQLTEDMASINNYFWEEDKTQITVGTDNNIGTPTAWIEIDGNEAVDVSVSNTYTELTDAELWIRKVDANHTDNALTGAQFTLTGPSGETYTSYETAHGTYHIIGIAAAGTYTLTETKVPDKYNAAAGASWTVTVEAYETASQVSGFHVTKVVGHETGTWVTAETGTFTNNTLVVTNAPKLADLTIRKDFSNLPGDKLPAMVMVQVTKPDGTRQNVELNAAGSWTATLEDQYLGSYTVEEVEVSATPGYSLTGTSYAVDGTAAASPAALTLDTEGETVAVAITNTYKENRVDNPASFSIYKHNDLHQSMEGVQFTLFDQTGSTVVQGPLTTDANGAVTFTDLQPAVGQTKVVYTLKETFTPNGYIPSDTTWTVEVELKNGQYSIVLNEKTNIWENIYDWILGLITPSQGGTQESYYENGALVVHNTRRATKLHVTKNEAFVVEGQTVPASDVNTIDHLKSLIIDGSKAVSDSYAFTVKIADTEQTLNLGRLTSGEDWTESFDINYGEAYEVSETVSGNYKLTAVDNDGMAVTGSKASGNVSLDHVHSTDGIQVGFTNTYYFSKYNEHDDKTDGQEMTVCLEFTKIASDTGAALSGAAFTLYKVDANGLLAAVGDPQTTDANGKLHFDVHEEGSYILRETTTPVGYKTAEDVAIEVTKTYDTFEEGGITYIVKKLNAKSGATELGKDKPLTITNEKNPGELTVGKVFTSKDGSVYKNMPEADYQNGSVLIHVHGPIRMENGSVVESSFNQMTRITLNDANDWTDTLPHMEKGTYYIHEAFASLHGYNHDSVSYGSASTVTYNGEKYVEFLVTDASPKLTLTVTNQYTRWTAADFYVHKTDSVSGKPMAGVTFTLHTQENCTTCNGCVSAVTDTAGHAHFTGLEIDTATTAPAADGAYYKYFYLKETTPDNYETNNSVYPVTLSFKNTAAAGEVEKWVYDLDIDVPTERANDSFDHSTDELRVENAPILGSIVVSKTFDALSDIKAYHEKDHPYGLQSAAFNVLDAGGNIVDTVVLPDASGKWEATVENLRMGTYTVVEAGATRPNFTLEVSYQVNGGQATKTAAEVTLAPAAGNTAPAAVNVVATNKYTGTRAEEVVTPTGFQVYKINEDFQPLAGAEFTLYKDQKYTDVYKTVTTGADGIAAFDNLLGNRAESTLPAGKTPVETTFYLKETKAPAGYEASDIVWTVKLNADQTTLKVDVYNPYTNLFETIINWVTGLFDPAKGNHETHTDANGNVWSAYDNSQLTVQNMPRDTKLHVAKQEVFVVEGEVIPASDVNTISHLKKLTVNGSEVVSDSYAFSVKIADTEKQLELGRLSSGETWSASYDIHYGDSYEVKETSTGKYMLTQINNNGTAAAAAASGQIGLNEVHSADGVHVTFTNTYYFSKYNEHEDKTDEKEMTACLEFIKKADEPAGPLAGATFTLYKVDANGQLAAVGDPQTTGADGRLHFDVHEEGTYILRETGTPAGYKTGADVEITVSKTYETFVENGINYTVKKLIPKLGTQELTDANNSIVNIKNNGTITLTKQFLSRDNASSVYAPMDPAAYQNASVLMHVHGPIEEKNGQIVESSFNQLQRLTLENGATVGSLSNLEPGTYYVHEAFASLHGYNLIGEPEYSVLSSDAAEVDYDGTDYVKMVVVNGQTSSATVTNHYEKWDKADFYVHKTDSVSGDPMGNVAFTLHTVSNCTDCTANQCVTVKTDASGHAHFTELSLDKADPSTYSELKNNVYYKYFYLKETTPDNYESNNTEYLVTLSFENVATSGVEQWVYDLTIDSTDFDHDIDELRIENTPILGSVKIAKAFADDSDIKAYHAANNPYGLQSAAFNILDASGAIVKTVVLPDASGKWEATAEGLRMGTYTVVEAGATRPNFTLEVSYSGTGVTEVTDAGKVTGAQFTLAPAGNTAVNVVATNKYTGQRAADQITPAGFQVYKIDEDFQPMAGAQFTLYKDAACTTAEKSVTTNAQGIASFADLLGTIAANGQPQQVKLYLKETAAPAGYKASDVVWEVTISADRTSLKVDVFNPHTNLFETIINWVTGLFGATEDHKTQTDANGNVWSAYDNSQLTVQNMPMDTKLTVKKAVKYFLDGAELDLTTAAAQNLIQAAGSSISDSYVFDVTINGVKQTNSALAAMKDGDSVELDIYYGDKYSVKETVGANAIFTAAGEVENQTIGRDVSGAIDAPIVTITNSYNIWEYDDHDNAPDGDLKACLEIRKVDEATRSALEGAKFELYSGTTKVAEGTTNASGILHLHVTAAGTYTLKEVEAPAGYQLSTETVTFNVTEEVTASTDSTGKAILIRKLVVKQNNAAVTEPVVVTNERKAIDLTVNKVWNDDNYYDRPSYVKVVLMKDGQEATGYAPITLSERNQWTGGWTDLDGNANWSVEEAAVGRDYEAPAYSAMTVTYPDGQENGAASITITNTRVSKDIEVTVKKVWKGKTGTSVKVRLYEDGKLKETVEITAKDNWTYVWDDLKDNHYYEVDEVKLTNYYKQVTTDGKNNWTITNSYSTSPKTGDNIIMVAGLMAVSAAALVVLLIVAKKRKDKK